MNYFYERSFLLALIRFVCIITTTATGSLILPFGYAYGDTFLPAVLDTSSPAINFTHPFPFLGTNQSIIHVNTHGILSFHSSYIDPSPQSFTSLSRAVIAIYWADGDLRHSGSASFRITQRVDDITRVQSLVSSSFHLTNFDPTLIFVVTYSNLPQTYQTSNNLKNTFQAVLATDGRLSFVLMYYEDIQWYGNANIGFNSGHSSFSLPGALTPDAVHIDSHTNVGSQGLFIYRVDQDFIIQPNNVVDVQMESPAIKKFSDCSERDQIQDGIIRDVVQLLSTEYGFEPLGRLREFPATSCEAISRTYFRPGQYWIAQGGMEPTLQYCHA